MSTEIRPTDRASPTAPAVVIVMGVSGCGKSTVGALLALRLRWEFEDADLFHSASNVEKMHNGVALTDEDRRPRLSAIAAWIDRARGSGRQGVVACSALKRRYPRCIDRRSLGRSPGLPQGRRNADRAPYRHPP
jgi:gluconokinase